MLPSSGAAMLSASGPNSDQPASSKTTARPRMSSPRPPYSSATCGAKTSASRAASCRWVRSFSPPAATTPPSRSSSGATTVRTNAAVRAASSATCGSGVRLDGHQAQPLGQGQGTVGDADHLPSPDGHALVGALAPEVPDIELLHDDRGLPAAEGLVPRHVTSGQVPAGPRGVALDDLVAAGQAEVLGSGHSLGGGMAVRPVVQQRPQVGQRIAQRRHVPVEDRGDAGRGHPG